MTISNQSNYGLKNNAGTSKTGLGFKQYDVTLEQSVLTRIKSSLKERICRQNMF